jgi:hypothetical protein
MTMANRIIDRDERTVSVENAGYRWAYMFVTYGLLLSVAYRAFVREEASWDLLALVIVSGGVATMYQGRHRVLSRPWLIMTLMAIAMALLLAATLVLLRRL